MDCTHPILLFVCGLVGVWLIIYSVIVVMRFNQIVQLLGKKDEKKEEKKTE